MAEGNAKIAAERVVVIMPNWLGDGVMATPFLRALRGLYPGAKIAAVARPLVAPVLAGLPFVDETFVEKKGEEAATRRFLREGRFELGVLLPNSFRSAWGLWRGGVRNRVGYARDWRSPLLTRSVRPMLRSAEQRRADAGKAAAIWRISSEDPVMPTKVKVGSKYQPVPTIEYYLALARLLGAEGMLDRRMELGVTVEEREEAEGVVNAECGMRNGEWVVMVPGANFGSSKCWPPEYFAQVADALIETRGATVLLASSPAELPIVEAILAASKRPDRVVALAKLNEGRGVSVGALKQMVRRCLLMVCNDTGPRHFAAAFGVPVVTLFGPTDPVWAETFVKNERQVRIEVPCGPCQLKKCPIDHRCMVGLGPEMVVREVTELLSEGEPEAPDGRSEYRYLFSKRRWASSSLTTERGNIILLFQVYDEQYLRPGDRYTPVLRLLQAIGSARNIFCFTAAGELVWRVGERIPPRNDSPFSTAMSRNPDGTIAVNTWSGDICRIDPLDGRPEVVGWTK